MCDELGDEKYMQQYVMEAGNVETCSLATQAGCSEKEISYINTWKTKSASEIAAQQSRLEGMKTKNASKLKEELVEWIGQRLRILKQIAAAQKEEVQQAEL